MVRGCRMRAGHGGVTIGSEVSGSVRDVFVERTRDEQPRPRARASASRRTPCAGGTIENVFVRDVEIGETGSAIDIDMLYEEGAAGAFTPVVRNVVIDRMTVRKARLRLLHPRARDLAGAGGDGPGQRLPGRDEGKPPRARGGPRPPQRGPRAGTIEGQRKRSDDEPDPDTRPMRGARDPRPQGPHAVPRPDHHRGAAAALRPRRARRRATRPCASPPGAWRRASSPCAGAPR